jgi:hypothetical protein
LGIYRNPSELRSQAQLSQYQYSGALYALAHIGRKTIVATTAARKRNNFTMSETLLYGSIDFTMRSARIAFQYVLLSYVPLKAERIINILEKETIQRLLMNVPDAELIRYDARQAGCSRYAMGVAQSHWITLKDTVADRNSSQRWMVELLNQAVNGHQIVMDPLRMHFEAQAAVSRLITGSWRTAKLRATEALASRDRFAKLARAGPEA